MFRDCKHCGGITRPDYELCVTCERAELQRLITWHEQALAHAGCEEHRDDGWYDTLQELRQQLKES